MHIILKIRDEDCCRIKQQMRALFPDISFPQCFNNKLVCHSDCDFNTKIDDIVKIVRGEI